MTSRRADWLCLPAFALVAAICSLLWWRGVTPFPFLGGDVANLASYAAALDHPGRFAADPAIDRPANFALYATIHVPLMRVLAAVLGDYGSAYLSFLPVTIFIQAVGFYLLGRVLTGSPLWAFALALASLGKIDLRLDYWGVYHDAQARMMFGALIPYVLAAALHWCGRPSAWAGIMAAMGLLMYVHPVSTPSVALALWLALWPSRPTRRAAVQLLGCGVLFVLVTLPFDLTYLANRAPGAVVDYQAAQVEFVRLFGTAFAHPGAYALEVLTAPSALILLAGGLAGAVATRRDFRTRFLLVWLVALAFASVGVAGLQAVLCDALRVLPLQVDIIRNVRYIVLALLLLSFAGAHRLAGNRPGLALVLAVAWLGGNPPGSIPVRATLSCLAGGRLLCPPPESDAALAVLTRLKDEPAGTAVLPLLDPHRHLDLGLAVRYHALQPVVYSLKDGGTTLYYNSRERLPAWFEAGARVEAAYAGPSVEGAEAAARELGARVVLTDLALDPPPERVLLRAPPFVLWRVH